MRKKKKRCLLYYTIVHNNVDVLYRLSFFWVWGTLVNDATLNLDSLLSSSKIKVSSNIQAFLLTLNHFSYLSPYF